MDDETIRKLVKSYDIEEEEEIQSMIKYIRSNDLQGLIASKILRPNTAQRLWSDVENARDILHTRNRAERGPHRDLTAVIMGGCGNGKTSLLNNLCGTSHPTGESLHSQTRNVTAEPVQLVEDLGKFIVYDTPGTTAHEGMSMHAALLRASLTHKPLNVVFVSIKFENRGIQAIIDMQKQIECIDEYANHVVYLISHADAATDLQKMMAIMLEEMNKQKMQQQVVFYSNTRCDRRRLARTLFDIASNYPKTKINISEDDFLKKFRIGSLDRLFENDYKQKLQEMDELTDEYIQCAVGLNQDEEKEYKIQELALDLKYRLQQRLAEFTEKAHDLMDRHDYYGVYFALQKIILDSDERFHSKTRHFLSYKMMHPEESDYKENILDLIRECPSCKEIWLRIEECPWATCGQRPISFWDYSVGRRFFTYEITRANNKLEIKQKVPMMEATANEIRIAERYALKVEESRYFKGIWEKKKEEEELRSDIKKLEQEEQMLQKQLDSAKVNKHDLESFRFKENTLKLLLEDISRDNRRCLSDLMLIRSEAKRAKRSDLETEEKLLNEALKRLPNHEKLENLLEKISAKLQKAGGSSITKSSLTVSFAEIDEAARQILRARQEMRGVRESCRRVVSSIRLSSKVHSVVPHKENLKESFKSIVDRLMLARLQNIQEELVRNRDQLRSLEQKHREDERNKRQIIGCGFRMNFKDLPRIRNIDKKLREWFNVTDISEIDVKLKADTNIVAQRQKIDKIASENMEQCNKHLRDNNK